MKRYLLLLLALAGLTSAGQFFNGDTTTKVPTASLPQFAPGDQQFNLYVSGPASGTWGARISFYALQGDGALRLLVTDTINNSGPNIDGTATRAYDNLALNIKGGSQVFAGIMSKSGTIPAPGLFAENK